MKDKEIFHSFTKDEILEFVENIIECYEDHDRDYYTTIDFFKKEILEDEREFKDDSKSKVIKSITKPRGLTVDLSNVNEEDIVPINELKVKDLVWEDGSLVISYVNGGSVPHGATYLKGAYRAYELASDDEPDYPKNVMIKEEDDVFRVTEVKENQNE